MFRELLLELNTQEIMYKLTFYVKGHNHVNEIKLICAFTDNNTDCY